MAGRDLPIRAEPGPSLPFFDRLAAPTPPDELAALIDAHSRAGDIVLDLHSRGGWVARAAIAQTRRAAVIESTPLTRLLAEIVLRPPDVRHLDAAFQAIAAAPRAGSTVKAIVDGLFAGHCASCGRVVVVDDVIWDAGPEDEHAATAGVPGRPARIEYHCPTCRDQPGRDLAGRGLRRHAPMPDEDATEIAAGDLFAPAWTAIRDRFPGPWGDADGPPGEGDTLADQLVALHTPRQLVGLHAILAQVEGELRAAPVTAALRLAMLHAVPPAGRLNRVPGRTAALRVAAGRVRLPGGAQWRERNPWLAFEDGYRLVRGFVQQMEASAHRIGLARFGDDLQSLGEGMANVAVAVASPSTYRALATEGRALRADDPSALVRLVLGQAPLRWTPDRLAAAYHGTAWVLGREAAAMLPVDLLVSGTRTRWDADAEAIAASLEAAGQALAPDGQIVLLVDAGVPEALVAAALGGAGAGCRLVEARLHATGDEESGGIVRMAPPGAPPGRLPRTRANVPLSRLPGASVDEDGSGRIPGPGIFGTPAPRVPGRPAGLATAEVVSDTAVDVLKDRGEPAPFERLLGEILVGLDRAGQLRPAAAPARPSDEDAAPIVVPEPGDEPEARRLGPPEPGDPAIAAAGSTGTGQEPERVGPHVEELLELIRGELTRTDHRRLLEIEPGQWWLASPKDRSEAAIPLSDRVEWSVFSLLSTAGRISESAFYDRLAGMFRGHDLPDEALVTACLESYRADGPGDDLIVPRDDLQGRSEEHDRLIAELVEMGHRIGLNVWVGHRQQGRRVDRVPLGERLSPFERSVHLPLVSRGDPEVVGDVDCAWYVRHRATFLFEVEWTAMLGETLLLRHPRIPTDDELVRFLVVLPERTKLIRFKLARSPLLRQALADGNWHILKADHLRTLAARESLTLADLEPYLGLDPAIEGAGEQMPLFEA